jgi:uncharacterized delta-60 repeat protein
MVASQRLGKLVLLGPGRRPGFGRTLRTAIALAVVFSSVPVSPAGQRWNDALPAHAAAGDLDTSFGTQGITTVTFAPASADRAAAMVLQADGKIIVAGVTNAGGSDGFGVARLNHDGSVDSSFGVGGLASTDFGSAEPPWRGRAGPWWRVSPPRAPWTQRLEPPDMC